MEENSWNIVQGAGPLVGAAIHCGHYVRDEVAELLALADEERLREEDPFTDKWASIAPSRVIGLKSRFELDLNRPREKAVYLSADDAWGLQVWKAEPPQTLIEDSLAIYDEFYRDVHRLLTGLVERHERVVVYDLHSYNHRRSGPDEEPADHELNPEINIGTGTMYRRRWVNVVDRFLADLHAFDFQGRKLDVRENVRFRGGSFPRWIHEQFPRSVCVLSIEIKKFFMDEWTGQPDTTIIDAITEALQSTVDGVLEELAKL